MIKILLLPLLLLAPIMSLLAQQNSAQTLFLAEKMEQRHQPDSAIQLLSANIAVTHIDSAFIMIIKRGYLYMSQNKDLLAQADFENATKSKPYKHEGYEALGYLFLKINKFENAIHQFNTSIEKGGNSTAIYFCRAHAYWDLKKCNEALKDLEIVLIKDSKHDNANYLKGRIFAYLGKHKEAVTEYTIAMDLVPKEKQAEVLGYRGISHMVLHQRQLAEDDLKKSIEGGMHRIEITTAYEAVRTRK